MTPEQFEAICARDRDYDDIFEQQAAMSPHIANRLVAWPVHDRRELRKYAEELQARVKIEVAAKKEFERDWLKAIDAQGSAEDELAALKAAAGKVRCAMCERMGHAPDEPCEACDDLRRLLA